MPTKREVSWVGDFLRGPKTYSHCIKKKKKKQSKVLLGNEDYSKYLKVKQLETDVIKGNV